MLVTRMSKLSNNKILVNPRSNKLLHQLKSHRRTKTRKTTNQIWKMLHNNNQILLIRQQWKRISNKRLYWPKQKQKLKKYRNKTTSKQLRLLRKSRWYFRTFKKIKVVMVEIVSITKPTTSSSTMKQLNQYSRKLKTLTPFQKNQKRKTQLLIRLKSLMKKKNP